MRIFLCPNIYPTCLLQFLTFLQFFHHLHHTFLVIQKRTIFTRLQTRKPFNSVILYCQAQADPLLSCSMEKKKKKYGENQYLPALCEIGALCYLCPGGTDIFLLRRLRIPTSILVLFYLLKNRFVSSFYFSGVQKKIEHPLVIHHKLNFIDMT